MVTSTLLPTLVLLALTCSALPAALESPEPEPEPEPGTDTELVEAVEQLLEKIRSELPEKRAIPRCAVGGRCAMRLGPRFGPLCECGGGSYCNSFLLKCI